MNNEALNRRIATELMGWKQKGEPGLGEYYVHNGVSVWEDPFSPTTDMRAAYVVLEKIASKGEVEIQGKKLTWSIQFRPYRQYYISSAGASLSLAISKLAESILDSPEHMSLFTK